ncbi:ROK family protein [Halalkalibacter kiskunsagensis]|uniref:fructokinase n=1 Tax=Halalkalibacter kiskunsagensis TaxID=1548599 RepID=A0ABV6K6U1_9BACI
MVYGAIEAGGTKFVCAVGDEEGNIFNKITIPTEDPQKTLSAIYSFFDEYPLTAIGIGSFGPIELNKKKANFGEILNTPKLQWKNFNIYDVFVKRYNLPTFLSTDVNVAALGEFRWGAAKDVDSCLYMTVGTGVGAGFVNEGTILNAWNHPEMGHIHVPRNFNDIFEGSCPYHKDCLEGLASGSALEARYNLKGSEIQEHQREIWELEGQYLAKAIMNYSLVLGPEKVILGGGVMKQTMLYPIIRKELSRLLNDYITIDKMEDYIVAPSLNDEQGIKGALALASER